MVFLSLSRPSFFHVVAFGFIAVICVKAVQVHQAISESDHVNLTTSDHVNLTTSTPIGVKLYYQYDNFNLYDYIDISASWSPRCFLMWLTNGLCTGDAYDADTNRDGILSMSEYISLQGEQYGEGNFTKRTLEKTINKFHEKDSGDGLMDGLFHLEYGEEVSWSDVLKRIN